MREEKKMTDEELAVSELIADTVAVDETETATEKEETTEKKEGKIFKKYKIKDIVFLAIITAITLITASIMPLLIHVPLFGIIQLGLGIQFSLFPVIGMMKVRKAGSLVLMALFSGVLLVFMFPPMFFCLIICALIAEAFTLIIFRGYDKDRACVFAGTMYMPLTLPFLAVYYNVMYDWSAGANEAVSQFVGTSPLLAIGVSLAVVAVCFIGSMLGRLITKELKKAGKLKQ